MTTEFSPKQPYEAYAISFDFAGILGAEVIASFEISAIDQATGGDATEIILDPLRESNADTIVYGWVRAGTSGHSYLITCRIVGSLGSLYELDGILPVAEIPDVGVASGGGCVAPPVIEPITLAELKTHLRLDSGTFDGNLTLTQSLAYGSKGISAGGAYTHLGAGVDVLGKQAEVLIHHGTNGATGTVDTKIQEADALAGPYTDWTGGAFTQVTTANDNTDYKKAYTGAKQYIRTASKVLLAACEFGTSILVNEAVTAEDSALERLRKGARREAEHRTWRYILTQTWDFIVTEWPAKNYIEIPGGNLQTVSSVKWKDTAGTETTLTAGTDYLVETNGEECGRVVLPYGKSWPSGSLYPSNPITIRFTAGWATAADVPEDIVTAILFIAENRYYHGDRGEALNRAIDSLLYTHRLWRF